MICLQDDQIDQLLHDKSELIKQMKQAAVQPDMRRLSVTSQHETSRSRRDSVQRTGSVLG